MLTLDEFVGSNGFRPGLLATDASGVAAAFGEGSGTTEVRALLPSVGGQLPSSDFITWEVTTGGPEEAVATALWSAAARLELVNNPILAPFASSAYIDPTTGTWNDSLRSNATLLASILGYISLRAEDNLFATRDVLLSLESGGQKEGIAEGGWLSALGRVLWRGAEWAAEKYTWREVSWWAVKEAAGGVVGQVAYSAAEYGVERYLKHRRDEAREEANERRRKRRQSHRGVDDLADLTPLWDELLDGGGDDTLPAVAGWRPTDRALGGYVMLSSLVKERMNAVTTPVPAAPDVLVLDIDLHR